MLGEEVRHGFSAPDRLRCTVTLGRDETLIREKNRSLSVSVLFIIVATALTVDDFLKLWVLLR